jgi:hypothetical protein
MHLFFSDHPKNSGKVNPRKVKKKLPINRVTISQKTVTFIQKQAITAGPATGLLQNSKAK